MTAGIAVAHDANADEAAFGPLHRHRPGEAARCGLRAKVHFHRSESIGGKLGLRRLKQQARHPEPEPALQPVAGAAGQHAHPATNGPVGRRHGHAGGVDVDRRHAAPMHDHAAPHGLVGQPLVEPDAVDHHRLDRRRFVLDGLP